ncbi:cysteine--tRNA ligase [Clostridium sp. CAG:1000]|jgi:cysteinyl-tRNA synthetase|nr:cysteine--tRNA ligase [Clostridium sp. CAG:1000]
MSFKIYNTLGHKIEDFIPYNKDKVTMYTCGPTVYHYAHIGNLRSYICEDVLEKALNYCGYNVKRVMNITDVGHLSSDADTGEDKMLKGAKREHKTVLEIAKYYTDCFKNDCDRLNIKWPETVVPATSLIDDYIKFIEVLMEKGYAYFTNGNVYFDTSKLKEYYQLTNHNEEELMHGVRESVEEDTNKRNKTDFVLWFTKSKFDSQELKWQSPWGMGYPGWHIECSCISLKYLGEQLDIHCGGVDNIFPHHTNEIAQTESYIGKKWCNYWFHVEHLNDKSGKMSKSNGEFLTVDLLIKKGFNPLAYRLFCLQSHYQKQLLFTYESLEGAQNTYDKLISKIKSINEDSSEVDKALFEKYNNMFKETLCDNLNTSNSLTVLYDVLKSDLNNNTKLALIKSFDKVLSLDLIKEEKYDEELISYIEDMIIKRSNAKKEGNYELADSIRNELLERGIILKDTREGTVYEVK